MSFVKSQLTSLATGRYKTKSDVSEWANLALDMAEIKDSTNKDEMEKIYENGKNVKYLDDNGEEKIRSLSSLSLEAFDSMQDDAMFIFFRYAFLEVGTEVEGENLGSFDERPVSEYANTLVLDLIKLGKVEAAPEAMLIMDVWMYIVHQLYEILRACKRNDDSTVSDMERALDIAAALWIGAEQEEGDTDSGNMLYNFAQRVGEHFDQGDGETTANYLIMEAFDQFKLFIELGRCADDSNAYVTFREKTHDLIGHMTIPLVQSFIYHIMLPRSADIDYTDLVELYALSIGARVEACVPTAYTTMEKLFVTDTFTETKRKEGIDLIQSVYSCLRVTCDQIGTYRTGEECSDDIDVEAVSYAGYYQTFDATMASRIDRDILQIKILTGAKAYGAALDFYTYGYNSDVSLKDLATSPGRGKIGQIYNSFRNYFKGDGNYADTLFQDIINNEGDFTGASTNQVRSLVTGLLTNIIMYMAILEKLYDALELCYSPNTTDVSVQNFDRAVAYYVGSIEGPLEGGLAGGQLLYGVAKGFCKAFSTCHTNKNALSNIEIMQAFDDASTLLVLGECSSFKDKIIDFISPLLLIPLIQGTLNAANVTDGLPVGSREASLADAFTFSRAIIPLFDNSSITNAETIAENLKFDVLTKPVPDGAGTVFEAVKKAIKDMKTPSFEPHCKNIGTYKINGGSVENVCDGLPLSSVVTFEPTVVPIEPAQAPAPTSTTKPTEPAPIAKPTELESAPTVEPTESAPEPALVPTANPTELEPAQTAKPIDRTAFPTQPLNFNDVPTKTPKPSVQTLLPVDSSKIGFGRYNFQNPIGGVAALSRDVRDMREAVSVHDANITYTNGKHAFVGANERIVSLATLSRTASEDMNEDLMYNIYRWALVDHDILSNLDTQVSKEGDSAYADLVVQKALGIAMDSVLAAETAVVLNVWMEITHELFTAIDYCGKGDNRSFMALDRGMALWIGVDQEESSFDTGYMMYSIAQKAADNFGLNSGESKVNTDIIDDFVDAQSIASDCRLADDSKAGMPLVVQSMLKKMTIPLLQNLIYYIKQENNNYIELYSLAVIPQAMGCSSTMHKTLSDALSSGKTVKNLDKDFYDAFKMFQKCLRINCADIIGNTSPDEEMRAHISELCYDENSEVVNAIAGFETINDVYEISRLDLDILQMGILMETGAFEAAISLYENGYNSFGDSNGFQNLRALARSSIRNIVPQYNIFMEYFSSENYGHELVMDALEGVGVFVDATKDQRAEGATRALQSMVFYMAILEKLYSAVEQCREGNENGVKTWEQGVALFVGSIEGSARGGSATGDGTLIYALAKETADVFGTTEGSGNAAVNEVLIGVLKNGRDLISEDDCDGALSIITSQTLEQLPIPMIQGTLFYADKKGKANSHSDLSYELASAYVLGESIQPIIYSVNITSAETIKSELFFNLNSKPVTNGADVVFDAVTFSLASLEIDCNDIGSYKNRTLCNSEVVNLDPETPTILSNGLYTTTTYVQDRANIALDLKAINDALNSGSKELALVLYRDGENSNTYDENGIKNGHRSFASFSTDETKNMLEEPLLNIYTYALQDKDGNYLDKEARLYADSIVNREFNRISPGKTLLVAEAMLILNLWMFLIHELYQTLENCKNKMIVDTDGVHSIDEAVAYWIGDGQITGDGDNGHLFYALAERMGDKFQINVNGQSKTNVDILRLFNQAKLELSFPDACSENPNTYSRLRLIILKILSRMTIPLVQSLIHYLKESDRDRVSLYSHSLIPLIAACNPELYAFLRNKLMENTYNVIETDDIIKRLQTVYGCLGISCDDVGQHVSDTNDQCIDSSEQNPIAGYTPSSKIQEYAQLDLDIFEISILMEMGALKAVDDLYSYGKHAIVDGINGPEIISLSSIATTSDRAIVPQFDAYVRYYEDKNYADTLIRTALDLESEKMRMSSNKQRKEIVVKSIQYLVIHMGALQALYNALSSCRDGIRNSIAEEAWDQGVALLIGSLEGSSHGGSTEGQCFYALSKTRCQEFGTCGKEGYSNVNAKLESLLYTGKGEIQGGSCNALGRTVKKIGTLLLIPLIQSNLKYAISNEKKAWDDPDFAAGYVFSRTILPMAEDVSHEHAETIKRNMDFQFLVEPVGDGVGAVFNAFGAIYGGLNINCNDIGDGTGINPCTGIISSNSKNPSKGNVFLYIFVSLVCLLGGFLLYMIHKRSRLSLEETAPIFTPSHGVLNHDTDLLNGKHNDAAILDGDEAFALRIQKQVDVLSIT